MWLMHVAFVIRDFWPPKAQGLNCSIMEFLYIWCVPSVTVSDLCLQVFCPPVRPSGCLLTENVKPQKHWERIILNAASILDLNEWWTASILRTQLKVTVIIIKEFTRWWWMDFTPCSSCYNNAAFIAATSVFQACRSVPSQAIRFYWYWALGDCCLAM